MARRQEHLDDERTLYAAVAHGHLGIVEKLLQDGMDVNMRNNNYETPLIIAARAGNAAMCKFLIENGTSINNQSNDGMDALHESARNGWVEICRLLLANGANVDSRDNRANTPLHLAAQSGKLEVIKLLLQRQADLLSYNDEGHTPLSLSILHDHAETAFYLLDFASKQQSEVVSTGEIHLEADGVSRTTVTRPRTAGTEEVYQMQSNPKGFALVINNINFTPFSGLKERKGAKVDGENISELLKYMNYEVEYHENCTRQDMVDILIAFSNKNHTQVDSAIIVIMSHGNKDVFYSTDGWVVADSFVFWCLNNSQCPTLREKPKIFIFQACRGDKGDYGSKGTDSAKSSVTDQHPAYDNVTHSDMYIARSTIPGYVSFLDEESGSWFVEEICAVFRELAHEEDLESMMKKVMKRVASRSDEWGQKQTVAGESYGLMYKVYFNLHP